MSLKNVFDAMKKEGYIVKDLDMYLLSVVGNSGEDRAIDVNAPSQVGACLRARYYARTGETRDPNSISSRSQRIFDNGTKVHERLQEYLKDSGKLLMDELPVHNEEHNIQGHTDGLFVITPAESKSKKVFAGQYQNLFAKEVGVLEIKSINDRGFKELKDAKPEHKMQGLVYLYCLETRRQYLKDTYATLEDFLEDKYVRWENYESLYQHLKDGSHYTRVEKIHHQCSLHDVLDNILYRLEKPIETVVFLYENKNDQELKEFSVTSTSAESKQSIEDILKEYDALNTCVECSKIPDREGKSKSDGICRWCDYKIACWN